MARHHRRRGDNPLKLSAIVLSRVLAFIDAVDLSPKGDVNFQDLAKEIAKHYRFQKFPQTLEEHDLGKGIEFLNGRSGKRTITKFVIWPNALVLETHSTTDESKELIEELLKWGTERFGLAYQAGMIKHYAYLSDLSFYSDAPLLYVSPLLENIAAKTSKALSEIWEEQIHYEPIELKTGHDPLARKWGIAPFQITRRAEHKFSDNKYFSEAPLPTDMHISLLEEYEAGIKQLHGLGE